MRLDRPLAAGLLFAAGCAGPVINPAFKERPAQAEVVRLLAPDFDVAEVGVEALDLVVGGYQATRASDKGKVLPDESSEAVRIILDEEAGSLEDRGFKVLRPISAAERDGDRELQAWLQEFWEGLRGMDRAFLRSGREAFPPDRGLGPLSPLPGRRTQARAYLVLYGRGQVESKEQRILGGILTGTNKNVVDLTVLLIEARTGALLWRNESSSPGADATRDWQLRSALRDALEGFPAIGD